MTLSDLPVVVDLERKIFPDPWPQSAFKEIIDQDGWIGLVAESNDAVIGYGCFYAVMDEAHLANIAVEESFRRKSVAKQLLDYILRFVSENGCQYIYLEVRPSNVGAIKFYEKFGFEILYKRPRYYRQPLEDALVMVKTLRADG
jgi:ribosomal-protein-alanine N-acetyltransferase